METELAKIQRRKAETHEEFQERKRLRAEVQQQKETLASERTHVDQAKKRDFAAKANHEERQAEARRLEREDNSRKQALQKAKADDSKLKGKRDTLN